MARPITLVHVTQRAANGRSSYLTPPFSSLQAGTIAIHVYCLPMEDAMSHSGEKHFVELLREFSTAMLTTHARNGELHARPMVVADVEEHGDIWLISDIHAEKVEELAEDARVNVSMQGAGRYVALSGKAEVVRDPERIFALWNEHWRHWFPQGGGDPALVLIRVRPVHGEFWDNEGLSRARSLYQTAKAYLTGEEPPEAYEPRGKVDLQGEAVQ